MMAADGRQLVELCFALPVDEDGWPPASVEGLWFHVVPDGYELSSTPMFVGDLSVGDVVQVDIDPVNGLVFTWRHVRKSRHSTIWLGRMKRSLQIHDALRSLRDLGCHTSTWDEMGVYAVHVPEHVALHDVDRILDAFDDEALAVACPSLRHKE
jgi:hypothetical protein